MPHSPSPPSSPSSPYSPTSSSQATRHRYRPSGSSRYANSSQSAGTARFTPSLESLLESATETTLDTGSDVSSFHLVGERLGDTRGSDGFQFLTGKSFQPSQFSEYRDPDVAFDSAEHRIFISFIDPRALNPPKGRFTTTVVALSILSKPKNLTQSLLTIRADFRYILNEPGLVLKRKEISEKGPHQHVRWDDVEPILLRQLKSRLEDWDTHGVERELLPRQQHKEEVVSLKAQGYSEHLVRYTLRPERT